MIFIHRAPKTLPSFCALVDEQTGNLQPDTLRRLADYLGLSVQLFQKYLESDDAPHAVRMALWWISRDGIATLDTEIFNERRMLTGQVRSLQEAIANLVARVARLEGLGGFGSANLPYFYPQPLKLFDAQGHGVSPLAVMF